MQFFGSSFHFNLLPFLSEIIRNKIRLLRFSFFSTSFFIKFLKNQSNLKATIRGGVKVKNKCPSGLS